MRIQNKRLVISLPIIITDFLQLIAFPINYLLGWLCYIQPQTSVWNEQGFENQDVTGSGIGLDELKHIILEREKYTYTEADIVRLFDSLPIASAENDLINRVWQGKILRTNRSALDFAHFAINLPLRLLGFRWGKRYCTANRGDPLYICWLNRIYLPIPFWGNVSMVDVRWRGKATATMVYDHQPWKDFFRVLSNDGDNVVMLGVWTHKHIAGGWFTLTLDTAISATKPK